MDNPTLHTLITRKLIEYELFISYENSNNRFNFNHNCENIFKPILNCLYGYKLINLNDNQFNAPGVDLVDGENGVCIQVTSNNSFDKVKDTVSKYITYRHYKAYPKLILFILGKKSKHKKHFTELNMIIDLRDINRLICSITDFNTLNWIYQHLVINLPCSGVQEDGIDLLSPIYNIISASGYNRLIQQLMTEGYDEDSISYYIDELESFVELLSNMNNNTRDLICFIIKKRIHVYEYTHYTNYVCFENDILGNSSIDSSVRALFYSETLYKGYIDKDSDSYGFFYFSFYDQLRDYCILNNILEFFRIDKNNYIYDQNAIFQFIVGLNMTVFD